MHQHSNVIRLPGDFIGKGDESKLASFASHLISRGAATRWYWQRVEGIGTGLLIIRGTSHGEELIARIGRNSARDTYHAEGPLGRRLAEGPLEAVLAVVDRIARNSSPPPLA